MTADDVDTIKKELQNFFSDGLVTVVGSGLSCAESLPGMQELAVHLLATVGPALSPADAIIWSAISAAIKANGLEAALLKNSPTATLEATISPLCQCNVRHLRLID